MTGRVVHFEIPFDDGTRARQFYSGAFGWRLDEAPEMDYVLARTGPGSETGPSEPGFIDGGMAQRDDPLSTPTVVIDVEDIDATLERVESLGGRTKLEKTAVGEMGFSAYFEDTEGNVIGLWQSAVKG